MVLNTLSMVSFHKIQSAYLSLISAERFNQMNGQEIAKDLIDNRHLWQRVIPSFTIVSDSVKPESNEPFFDTLIISTEPKHKAELKRFCIKWKASGQEWFYNDDHVLHFKIWWL